MHAYLCVHVYVYIILFKFLSLDIFQIYFVHIYQRKHVPSYVTVVRFEKI